MFTRLVGLFCAAMVAVGSGCQYLGLTQQGPQAVSSGAALRASRGGGAEDLTAGESAAACVATAQEMVKNGWDGEAITVYERALSFEPDRKGVSLPLARLYARVGDVDRARELFQKAVVESPGDSNVRNDFGYFLYELGELPAAESQLRRALELSPGEKRSRTNLALTLAAADRYDESLKLFEEAVGPAAARSNLAVVLAQAGELSKSREMVASSQAIDPTIVQAKMAKKWLDGSRATKNGGQAVQSTDFQGEVSVEDVSGKSVVRMVSDPGER